MLKYLTPPIVVVVLIGGLFGCRSTRSTPKCGAAVIGASVSPYVGVWKFPTTAALSKPRLPTKPCRRPMLKVLLFRD
jgi:hypothetical protein